MQIVEVKNNLVKISYNTMGENLILSGFVVVKDLNQSFIGQVIHLEANQNGNFAVLRLLFNFDSTGVITSYNGSIPALRSVLETVATHELLDLLPVQNPLIIGDLAQQKTLLNLDFSLLEKKLLICCEKNDEAVLLTKNFAKQIAHSGQKLLVINTDSTLELDAEKIVAGESFKLPLNYETINFIYEKGLTDAKAETKALIQEIFLEVQNYVKTLPEKFVPFESFRTVVDYQHEETGLVELVLLKNKLLKYYEEGVFAQDKDEFNALKISLRSKEPTHLDLSNVSPEIQREMISYAYSLIEQSDKDVYVILNVHNSASDKKLLKQIFKTNNAYSTLICSYAYKYLTELKQISKNLILFTPLQQQNDFAYYNTFLNKLNPGEFVIYGEATHHLPLIVRLDEISDTLMESTLVAEPTQEHEPLQATTPLDEEIKRDVDKIYTAPKASNEAISPQPNYSTEQEVFEEESQISQPYDNEEMPVSEEIQDYSQESEFNAEVQEDDLTEDDLDFIEDLHIVEDAPVEAPSFEPEIVEQKQSSYENIEIVEQPAAGYQEEIAEPQQEEILPVQMASTPIVPIYSADIEPQVEAQPLQQGEVVTHPKYGRGTVEKLITYGTKTLCSINFDNVGRRLLDPTLSELTKGSL